LTDCFRLSIQANATADLILFALHDLLISPGEDPLPLYSFARDLRTLGNFVESVETMNLARKPPRFRRLAQLCTDLIGNTRHSKHASLSSHLVSELSSQNLSVLSVLFQASRRGSQSSRLLSMGTTG
jgi:hypothetical protein